MLRNERRILGFPGRIDCGLNGAECIANQTRVRLCKEHWAPALQDFGRTFGVCVEVDKKIVIASGWPMHKRKLCN
jgi:hypothetical protein